MKNGNWSTVTEFILLGLSDDPILQKALFILFLLMYIIGVQGNSVIFSLITTNPKLHSPMYFFIANLSLVDISLTTITVPKLLLNILTQIKTISFPLCITQLYFFVAVASIESLFLGLMAYDRYVAICNPLRYTAVMNTRVCAKLACSTWLTGFLNSLLHSGMISVLSFCGPNQIQNFFCDIPPLLKLSCSDTTANELVIFTESSMVILTSVLSIVVSYALIIITICRMRSSEGRLRAFSTCSSHLMVVALFYGTIVFTYIRPRSSYSLGKDKVVSVIYTTVTPMLNPFIYSLRNEQVKDALRKVLGRKTATHKI
ncbi:olfactory receptor 5AP2-like [Pleurodeles waltl]|uniref:olfactory receptor 5AP2-like n=1 Tax=Pleurodeles waltl TaxID=8319 RepID=UPI0037093A80